MSHYGKYSPTEYESFSMLQAIIRCCRHNRYSKIVSSMITEVINGEVQELSFTK